MADFARLADSAIRPAIHTATRRLIVVPALLFAYLSLPRALLISAAPDSELGFSLGYADLTLAYVFLLTGVHLALQSIRLPAVTDLLLGWCHLDVLVRAVEAVLLRDFAVGYSPLVFAHLETDSFELAAVRYWPILLLGIGMMATAHMGMRRLIPGRMSDGPGRRLVAVLLVLLVVRSGFVLIKERRRLPRGDFAVAALAVNAYTYYLLNPFGEDIPFTGGERQVLAELNLDFSRPPAALRQDYRHKGAAKNGTPNLILVYVEGLQANLTRSGGSPYPGLTPHLDRFAARFVRADRFFNGATPTINALISSQCGILPKISNDRLRVDRGYGRNLVCLSDILAAAGYHQVFMGGANSAFSGKELFLRSHGYDEIWGWRQWRQRDEYRAKRHEWGLHDTDLAREALDVLSRLVAHKPFQLTLLTVNTHPPGYRAPECPEYRSGHRLLNAFHCTDHALGILLDGIEARGFLSDTVVVVIGDHPVFPSPANQAALGSAVPAWYGAIYFAYSAPEVSHARVIETAGYTPDLAPTVLDLLGLGKRSRFLFGRSLVSGRAGQTRLIAPDFEVIDGKMVPAMPSLATACPADQLRRTILQGGGPPLSECERRKIFALQERWLLGFKP